MKNLFARIRPAFAGTLGSLLVLSISAPAENLFVSDGNHSIYEFTPGGVQNTFATGLNAPYGLGFNSAGDLFVADNGSGSIYKFTPAGVRSTFATGLTYPLGLVVDTTGDVFLSEGGTGNIDEFTPGGAQSLFASGAGAFGMVVTIKGDLFAGEDTIFEYAPSGSQITSFPSPTGGACAVYGMAVDNAGNLFVAGGGSGNIYEITPGGVQSTFASGLVDPYALAFNSAGHLFAADLSDHIYEYTQGGARTTFASGVSPVALAFQPVPELSTALSGTNVIVSWPTGLGAVSYAGYTLQCTAGFSPASWSAVAPAPVVDCGRYTVTIPISGPQQFYRLSLLATPSAMALIPSGPFTMGDSLDGEGDAVPTVTANLLPVYMDANLVSYGVWQSIYNWAAGAGYAFDNAGSGKAANHPVQQVNWFDAVKWCNARSQLAGLTPVYYTDAGFSQVYMNGDVAPYVNWAANGYRLPTEAEWEKGARGGLSGQRFPWGNTISESQDNYYGETYAYSYDFGPDGYNALFATGGFPYTSPVGYFAPNGYGLYDMAGNEYEWCWDWYGTPYAGAAIHAVLHPGAVAYSAVAIGSSALTLHGAPIANMTIRRTWAPLGSVA